MTLRLSAEEARRFLVVRHGLAAPRSLPPKPESVLTVMDRIGLLQFDPLEVPGARNHDLVLHARIDGYRREWCEKWLYGSDRRLFEIYNKSLNIVPIGQLPHYRIQWARHAERYEEGILREQAEVASSILRRIEEEGPLSTGAFTEHAHSVDWWWAPTRVSRAVLEALFVTGRVGIARREGNRRFYDLTERLVPAEILARRESYDDASLHRLFSRFRGVGLTSPSAPAELMYGTGTAAERQSRTAELVERGSLLPVEVNGLKGVRYMPAGEKPMLEAATKGQPLPGGVAFIGPLDPLIWDRRLLRELWSFDYIWEVYVPEPKRRWGYYVLPILFGERLIGRFEPRLDRATADGFVPQMREALRAYMALVGARRVEWLPQTAGAGRLFGTLGRR